VAMANFLAIVTILLLEFNLGNLSFVHQRIVGGEDAKKNEFPWQVALAKSGENYIFCGGTLISSRTILTAAHCFEGFDGQTRNHFDVVLGEYDASVNEASEQRQNISFLQQVVRHEGFNSEDTMDKDFAIIKLNIDVDFTESVAPVCLPEKDLNDEGQVATVTGWGRLSTDGTVPNILQKVEVVTMSNKNCTTNTGWESTSKNITENMLCATNPGKSPCYGDSGGPLVSLAGKEYYSVIGVVSFGPEECADPVTPGVFSRVTSQLEWINLHVEGVTGDGESLFGCWEQKEYDGNFRDFDLYNIHKL